MPHSENGASQGARADEPTPWIGAGLHRTRIVDRAVIHPVMWDPDSNELAVEAAQAHPNRFVILGWFYLDRPESRALIDT